MGRQFDKKKKGNGESSWHFWPDANDAEAKAKGGPVLCARIIGSLAPPPATGFVWFYWKRSHSSNQWATVTVKHFATKPEALEMGATLYSGGLPPDADAVLRRLEHDYQDKRSAARAVKRLDGDPCLSRLSKAQRASRLATLAGEGKTATPEYAEILASLTGKAGAAESSRPFVELAETIMRPPSKATGPVWPQAGALLHDDNVEAFLALEGPRAPGDEAAALYLYVQHYASRSKEFAVFSGESRADGSWAREENLMRISGASGLPSQEVAIEKMRELAKKGAGHWRRDLHGQSIPDKPVF